MPLTLTALSVPLPVTYEHHGVEKAEQLTGDDSRDGENTSRLLLHRGKEDTLLRYIGGSFASIISSLKFPHYDDFAFLHCVIHESRNIP